MKKIFKLLILCLILSSCANPSYFEVNKNFKQTNWKRVAILPFSGDERFSEEVTDVFSMHLLKQDRYEVLEPAAIQDVIKKIVIEKTDNTISVGDAQRIGQLTNVDAVFLGNVNSYNNGASMNGFITIKLIDVASGKIVAATHKPSGLLIGWSEHQAVMNALERASKDMVKYLTNN